MISETQYIRAFDHASLRRKQIPMQGCLEVTYRCNHKCIHCSVINRKTPRRKKELTFVQIRQIVDSLAKAGCLWLAISGGEPFIRKDFPEIYRYIRQKGIMVTIDTNITLLTHRLVHFLQQDLPHGIETSLLSLRRENFDRIAGTRGAFDKFMRNLDLLLEHGIPFSCIRTPTMELNKGEIEEIRGYVEARGARYYNYYQMDCTIDGHDTPLRLALSPQEVIARKSRSGELGMDPRIPDEPGMDCLSRGMKEAFIINPYGELDLRRVIPCFPTNIDIRGKDFWKCWKSFLSRLPFYISHSNCECKGCPLLRLCRQCATHTKLKAINSPYSDYYCRIASLHKQYLQAKDGA